MTIPPQPVTAADLAAHTEQALVELVYVRTANEILGASMASLESALNISQSVLNILQALQNLKNYITVNSPGTFTFSYNDAGLNRSFSRTTFDNSSFKVTQGVQSATIDEYQNVYQSMASAYFGKPIDPVLNLPAGTTLADAQTQFNQIYQNIGTMITKLQTITPVANQNDPGTLLFQLKQVQKDMIGTAANAGANFSTWVLDNYNNFTQGGSSNAGALQANITTAITAAQSLNDSQKEDVRRFLFIFQEYYQSASAILSKITQIIEKMAQKISQ